MLNDPPRGIAAQLGFCASPIENVNVRDCYINSLERVFSTACFMKRDNRILCKLFYDNCENISYRMFLQHSTLRYFTYST